MPESRLVVVSSARAILRGGEDDQHPPVAGRPGPGPVRRCVQGERRRLGANVALESDELRQIGVTSVGHRKRLLEAITALSADTTGQVSAVRTDIQQATPKQPLHVHPERRQLTVMINWA